MVRLASAISVALLCLATAAFAQQSQLGSGQPPNPCDSGNSGANQCQAESNHIEWYGMSHEIVAPRDAAKPASKADAESLKKQ